MYINFRLSCKFLKKIFYKVAPGPVSILKKTAVVDKLHG